MAIFKNDEDAYSGLPGAHWVYNKLQLSEKLGYVCGPSVVPIPRDGNYIIRPIMNLSGMGIGARIETLKKGDKITDPSYFWCECFEGDHISVDYTFKKGEIFPIFACQGWNDKKELWRFNKWVKVDPIPEELSLPNWLEGDINSAQHINVEWIGGKIIEVHLRHGHDFPKGAVEIIPVWEDIAQEQHYSWGSSGYNWKADEDDADTNLEIKRLGFYWR